MQNSGGPDQMPHYVASDLGLHFLPNTPLGVSSIKRVKELTIFTFTCIPDGKHNNSVSPIGQHIHTLHAIGKQKSLYSF